jgi:hypothetical protein
MFSKTCHSIRIHGLPKGANRMANNASYWTIFGEVISVLIRKTLSCGPWLKTCYYCNTERICGPLSLVCNMLSGSFPVLRRSGREVDRSPLPSAKVKRELYPYYVLMTSSFFLALDAYKYISTYKDEHTSTYGLVFF